MHTTQLSRALPLPYSLFPWLCSYANPSLQENQLECFLISRSFALSSSVLVLGLMPFLFWGTIQDPLHFIGNLGSSWWWQLLHTALSL